MLKIDGHKTEISRLPKWLKKEMNDSGYNYHTFANASDVNESLISQYCRKVATPTLLMLDKMLDALGYYMKLEHNGKYYPITNDNLNDSLMYVIDDFKYDLGRKQKKIIYDKDMCEILGMTANQLYRIKSDKTTQHNIQNVVEWFDKLGYNFVFIKKKDYEAWKNQKQKPKLKIS